MAEYTLSAVLKLRDEMTGKLKATAKAVEGMSKSTTAAVAKGVAGVSKGVKDVGKGIADLKGLNINLNSGDLARIERLQGVMEAAGAKPIKPVNITANDSASSKIRKIQQELQSLTGKKWEAAVNIKDNAKAALTNAKGKISEGLSSGAMMAGATVAGLGAVGGVAYGVTDAFKSQMEFEREMSSVKAIMSGTYKDKGKLDSVMKELTAEAERLGMATKFTASEVATAMRYEGMAGWRKEQMVAGTGNLLNLASAGDVDLGTAADILTDNLTAFGLKAGEYVNYNGRLVESSKHYADLMAATVTNANTDVPQLGEALKYAAPVVQSMYANADSAAKMAGAEDTLLVAGLMANSGIKGSQAGTSIRAMLQRLSAQNRNAYFAENSLGIDFSDAKTGEARRLKDIVKDFRKAFKEGVDTDKVADFFEQISGEKIHADTRRKLDAYKENVLANGGKMSGTEAMKMASMLAGQEAMSGWLATFLASDEDFANLEKALDEAEGSTERMAKTRMDNLAGDITVLGSAWDAFQRNLVKGDASAGLRSFTQSITETLNKANELFKGGIDIGDFGEIIVDVIAKLKAKFLELDGIGSVLAGGTLIFGLKKILSMGLKVKDTLSAWSKVRTAGDVGDMIRGNNAGGLTSGLQSIGTMNVSVGAMNVRAGVVNLSGAFKGGAGGVGIGGAGGRAITSVNGGIGIGGAAGASAKAATVLTATQIAQQKAARSSQIAVRAQAKSDAAMAAAWARPGDAKLMAAYQRADLRAMQAQALATQTAARFSQLRASEESAAAYYARRESALLQQRYAADVVAAQNEAAAQKYARRRAIVGGAAGVGAMSAVFGLMDVAATRSNSNYNLNTAKEQVSLDVAELKLLREQGADVSQINAQINKIRQSEANVRQVSETNAENERRAGAGAAGMVTGSLIGAAIGSMVPVVGNMIGGMVGGVIGQFAGEWAADNISSVKRTKADAIDGGDSHTSVSDFRRDNETGRFDSKSTKATSDSVSEFRRIDAGYSKSVDEANAKAEKDAETAREFRKINEKYASYGIDSAGSLTGFNRISRDKASGYTSLTDLNNGEGWTDSRGGGMKTVDENSAEVRRQREEFQSGIAKNQSSLSRISANVHEGQERQKRFWDFFSFGENEDLLKQFGYTPLGVQTPTGTKATAEIETAPVGGAKAAEGKTSSTSEIETSPIAAAVETGGVQAVSNIDGRQGFTQTNTPLIPSMTANIPNAKAMDTESVSPLEWLREKFGTQSLAETSPASAAENTKTWEERVAESKASAIRGDSLIGQMENFSVSDFLESLIFNKAAASPLHEENTHESIDALKGYSAVSETKTEPRISTAAAIPTAPINFRQPDFGSLELPEINIAEKISSGIESASAALSAVKSSIAADFSEISSNISAELESAKSAVTSGITEIGAGLSETFSNVTNSVGETVSNFATNFSAGFENVKASASATLNELSTTFITGFESLLTAAATNIETLATSFSTGFESLKTGAATTISEISMSVSTGFESMWLAATTTIDAISTSLSAGFEAILSAATATFSSLSSTIGANVEYAHASISTAFSSAAAEVQGIWSGVQGFFSGVFGSLGGIAAAAGSAIAAGINSGIGMIQSAWEGLSGWLSSKIASLSAMASSAAAAIGIGGNAKGTSSWRGGFTTVNEHGGELIILPGGRTIAPLKTTQNIIAHNYTGSSHFDGGFSTVNEHGGELIVLPNGEKIYPHATTNSVIGDVAHNYSGTSFFEGGWSEVNGTGSELMYLPRGTKIINHATTVSILRRQIREKLRDDSQAGDMSSGYSFSNRQTSNVFSDSQAGYSWIEGATALTKRKNASTSTSEFNERKIAPVENNAIAHHYGGTSYFGGGYSTVNEHGGEIIQLPSGAVIYPQATARNILQREIRTDRLGNIRGLDVPEYNRISNEDSLIVRRAKYRAQLVQFRRDRRNEYQRRSGLQQSNRENSAAIAYASHANDANRNRAIYAAREQSVQSALSDEKSAVHSQISAKVSQVETRNASEMAAVRRAMLGIPGISRPARNAIAPRRNFIQKGAEAVYRIFHPRKAGAQNTSQQNSTAEHAQSDAISSSAEYLQNGIAAALSENIRHGDVSRARIGDAHSAISSTQSFRSAGDRLANHANTNDKSVASYVHKIFHPRKYAEKKRGSSIDNLDNNIRLNVTPIVSERAAFFNTGETGESLSTPQVSNVASVSTPRAMEIRRRVETDSQALSRITGKPAPEMGASLNAEASGSNLVSPNPQIPLFNSRSVSNSATSLTSSTSHGGLTRFGDSATADNRRNFLERGAESVNNFFYKIFHPRKYAVQQRGYETDSLGNIIGLNGISDNVITGRETIAVQQAKREAQRQEFLERQRQSKISEGIFKQAASSTTNLSNATISDTAKFREITKPASDKLNVWTLIREVLSSRLANRRSGGWRSIFKQYGDIFKRTNRLSLRDFTSNGGSNARITHINRLSLRDFASNSGSNARITRIFSGKRSSDTSIFSNTAGGSFASTKRKSNVFKDIVNIWRQSKKGSLLSFDNIWKPTLSYGGTPAGIFDFEGTPANLPNFQDTQLAANFGDLPIPNFDFPEMVKDAAAGGSNSTTNNTSSSSTANNFNFGGVNINNGADFDEFMNRLRSLIQLGAGNYAG